MIAHIHQYDLLVLNQQLQRDAVRQINGYRMQAPVLAVERMQAQGGVRWIGFQPLQSFQVVLTQVAVPLQKLRSSAVVLLGEDQPKRWFFISGGF